MKKLCTALAVIFCANICLADVRIFYTDGPRKIKKVSLTFDDGPGVSTDSVLEILREKDVKATFFLLGVQVRKNPNLTKKIVSEGHEIASHTYGHFNFYAYTEEDRAEKIQSELLKNEDIIFEIAGVKPFLVRFPHGYARPEAREIAKKNGYFIINWTFGCDWEKGLTSGEMFERYLDAAKNGAIFLMHDAWRNTRMVEFLPDLIDGLKEKGFEIVTVSELLSLNPGLYQKQEEEETK